MNYKTVVPWAFLFGLCGAAYVVSTPLPEQPVQERKKATIIELDETTLEPYLKKNLVLRLYQPSCPICRSVQYSFETAAEEYSNKLPFAQVNIVKNPSVADRFNINHPAILFFKDSKQVERATGLITPQELEAIIQMHYVEQ